MKGQLVEELAALGVDASLNLKKTNWLLFWMRMRVVDQAQDQAQDQESNQALHFQGKMIWQIAP